MENNTTENINLFSLNGFIGRRNYIANSLIINMLFIIISMPVTSEISFFNFQENLMIASHYKVFLFILSLLAYSFLFAINTTKRFSDITGHLFGKITAGLIFILILMISFMSYSGFESGIIAAVIMITLTIFLFIKKGKFSTLIKKSEIAKFNWGAFFGTWIWGLRNKVYTSLLAIPLAFTPAILIFPLLLGIKGNEWAYKYKEFSSIEEFHRIQKKEATFWSIFTPIFSAISAFLLIVGFATIIASSEMDAIENPDNGISIMETYLKSRTEELLDGFEYKDGIYGFYVAPDKWIKYTDAKKKEAFDRALEYVEYLDEKTQEQSSSKMSIYTKTKIYSSLNKEILFEFEIPKGVYTEKNLIKRGKLMLKAYKINHLPSLEK